MRVVLLGAGHAHVAALRRLGRQRLAAEVVVVTEGVASAYSGLVPAVVRGECGREAPWVAVGPVVRAAGGRLVVGEAVGIDLVGRVVRLAEGGSVGFDVLSVDVGGRTVTPGGGVGAKPIGGLLGGLEGLVRGSRVVVVGGGAGGVELALALGVAGYRVVLVAEAVLPGVPERAGVRARRALGRAGVGVVVGRGEWWDGEGLRLAGGGRVAAEGVVWATGVVAPEFLAESGLACDGLGCVRVGADLRSISHPFVLAAGDCAAGGRAKAGVWAVRAGPAVARALRRMVAGRAPPAWRPQRHGLVLIGLPGRRALGWRGRFVAEGRLLWRLKHWLDGRWVSASGAAPVRGGSGPRRRAGRAG